MWAGVVRQQPPMSAAPSLRHSRLKVPNSAGTVTPRAVSKAVLKAAQWAAANRDRLFAEGATK